MFLQDRVISWYSFDETAGLAQGVARGDSFGAHALQDVNTVGSAPGKQGNAASFAHAAEKYLILPSHVDFQADQDLLISLWFNIRSLPQPTHPVFVAKRTSSIEWQLGVAMTTPPGSLDFWWGNTRVTIPGIGVDTWYHALAWRDVGGGTFNLALNNGPVTSAPKSPIAPTDEPVVVGRAGSLDTGYMGGLLDELAIFNYVPNADDRTWLYNDGNGRSAADLAALISTGGVSRSRLVNAGGI